MKKEPKGEITIFYCTHQGQRVDQMLKSLNGAGELKVRRVGLPCSGKLEVFQLTRALESGAEAVALFGCPEGECRYVIGSTRAKGRVSYTRRILMDIGVEKERVQRFVLESQPRQEILEELSAWVEKIKALAPLQKNLKSKDQQGN